MSGGLVMCTYEHAPLGAKHHSGEVEVRAWSGLTGRPWPIGSLSKLNVRSESVSSSTVWKGTMATDWTFNGTWPYEPKWFDSADGHMHYVGEGSRDGKPVVMTWSSSSAGRCSSVWRP